MTPREPTRVVFDCNIYFQALVSPRGPSGACLTAAFERRVTLFCGEFVISELLRITGRPDLRRRLSITDDRVALLIESVEKVAVFNHDAPTVFFYPRDPGDARYVNLALATSSECVVTRDKDLLDLVDATRPEGREFMGRFPELRILGPLHLLAELAQNPAQP